MEGTHRACRVLCLLVGGLAFASGGAAIASEMGDLAAAMVSQGSYYYFMDEMLYTHAGDNRGFGPEHDLAQANIVSLMESYGLTVTLEPFLYGADTYYNVVGTKLGVAYPDQEYIIGAHYDSVNNPGADDNASGVALVLEAARVLKPFDSDYTIRFIAFDREEQGLHGSQAYVDAHMGDDILGMITPDMVAYNNGLEHFNIYGRTASNPLKNALGAAIMTYGDGLSYTLQSQFDASDHAPFEWAGYDACLLIEDHWDNPYYHDPEDNMDMPLYIDFAYATQITRVVVGFLVDHAGVSVVPLDGDFDEDGDVDQDDCDAFQACFTGPGGPVGEGCEPGNFDDDDDIDCGDWEEFKLVWTGPPAYPSFFLTCDTDCNGNSMADEFDIAGGTSGDCNDNDVPDECDIAQGTSDDGDENGIPDECEAVVPRPEDGLGITCTDHAECSEEARCVQGLCYVPKHRYVSIAVNPQQPPMTARRVKLASGELLGWVGEPYEHFGVTLADVVASPVYDVVDFTGSWPGVLHVTGCPIATNHTYHVQAIRLGQDIGDENMYSEALVLHTPSTWGDTVSTCGGGGCLSPDGLVGLSDIMAAINKYQGLDVAPLTWLDIDPSFGSQKPDQVIGAGDILGCIAGYQGEPYPGDGPLGCP